MSNKNYFGGLYRCFLLALIAGAVVFAFSSEAFALCDSCQETRNNLARDCDICVFVKTFLDAVNNIVTGCYNTLKGPSLGLLGVGLGLWLAWHMGIFFINYKFQDPAEFYTEIGKCFFRATVIFAFLIIPTQKTFDYLVSPVVAGFAGLAIGLLEDPDNNPIPTAQEINAQTGYAAFNTYTDDDGNLVARNNEGETTIVWSPSEQRDLNEYCRTFLDSEPEVEYTDEGIGSANPANAAATPPSSENIRQLLSCSVVSSIRDGSRCSYWTGADGSLQGIDVNGSTITLWTPPAEDAPPVADARDFSSNTSFKALSPQVTSAILCIVGAVYDEVAEGMAIGYSIYCYALENGPDLILFKIPDIGMLFIGLLVVFSFFIIALCVAFRLFDFIVRIGFVLMLMAPILVAWVFPSTRQFTKRAWDLFLNSLIALVCIVIAMSLCVDIVVAALESEAGADTDPINNYCNTGNVMALYNQIYTNGFDWILFLAMAIVSLLLMGKTQQIANSFVSISDSLKNTNVGASVGGKMAALAAKTVQAAVTIATVGLTVVTLGGGAVVGGAVKGATMAARQVAQQGIRQTARNVRSAAASSVRAAPRKFAGAVKQKAQNVATNVRAAPRNAINRVTSIPQNIAGNFKNLGQTLQNNVIKKITSAPKRFKNAVKNKYEEMMSNVEHNNE